VRCFIAAQDLGGGLVRENLLATIEASPNFVVVLNPGCLDTCGDPDDWLRVEIGHAIRSGRKIVPVLLQGFAFPPTASLPSEIASLPNFNAVPYSTAFVDAFVNRLLELLEEDRRPKRLPRIRLKYVLGFALVVAITSVIYVAIRSWPSSTPSRVIPVDTTKTHSVPPVVQPPRSWPISVTILRQIQTYDELQGSLQKYISAGRAVRVQRSTPNTYVAVIDSPSVKSWYYYSGNDYYSIPDSQRLVGIPEPLNSHPAIWLRFLQQ
jgi:hypothetical protein